VNEASAEAAATATPAGPASFVAIVVTIALLATMAAVWLSGRGPGRQGDAMVGKPAPSFDLKRLDGVDGGIALESFSGKPVLLDFFASWCAPCEQVAGAVAACDAAYRDRGLVTIGISFDSEATLSDLRAMIDRHGIAYPVVGDGRGFDGGLDEAFAFRSIPHLVLIDPSGKVATTNLAGASAAETTRNLQLAILALLGPVQTEHRP
jgi:peroxiredoxin